MTVEKPGDKGLFLVTGATGKTGGHTVRLLREHDLPVRALVRSLDERAQHLYELGADIIRVDLLNYSEIRNRRCSTRPHRHRRLRQGRRGRPTEPRRTRPEGV